MPDLDTGVPALLLRLDPNPFHHGTLGAVRSLGRAGVEVHAMVAPPGGPVARSRHLCQVHAPPATTSRDALHEALRRASDAIGRPALLLALDDRGAIAVAELAPALAGRYLLPEIPGHLVARVADKSELAALCAELAIPHPTTLVPDDPSEAADAVRELGAPVVAKWSRPWLLPPGMRSTTLVRNPAQASLLHRLSARAGSRLLLQRHLPGGRGTDWFFHGYAGEDGAFLVGGAGRKELSWPPRTGLTALGTWRPNPAVEQAAARLAARVGYRGVLDLDFRLDPVGGDYHLLDFNPRPGAQFRLFTWDGGLDVVRAQHLHLTGRAVPRTAGAPGRLFVAENYAALSALAALVRPVRHREARPRPPAPAAAAAPAPPAGHRPSTARRTCEGAWWAADDPLPLLAMAASWSLAGARRVLRLPAGATAPVPALPAPAPPGTAPQPSDEARPRPAAPARPGATREGEARPCTTS
ncbi:ATP-grasp domain-containing protein [Streptomyces sp. NPDC059740]|uniref:carboxylate--amine ligase n=1 Tax=Streptomyces sp. NPDC059740 TaxID=3346926 RepID=UPI0036643DCB